MRRRFGEFEFDLGSGSLVKNGVPIPLRVQPFQVLAAFLECPGEWVTRDQLRRRLWPTDTAERFESELGAAVDRLRSVLEDSTDPPRLIELVPERGYRFTGEIRRITSLAVAPFVNRSSAAEDYFCDGLTEEVIRTLSSLAGVRVCSRSAAGGLGDPPYELDQVDRLLKAGAMLEGSVQRSSGRARISVRISSVPDGFNLWSHTFDTEWKDVFAIHDQIASGVAKALAIRFEPKTPPHWPAGDAYLLYLKGRHLKKWQSPADLHRALDHFQESLRADPEFPLALHGAATCHLMGALMGWMQPRTALADADKLISHGLQSDPGFVPLHLSLAVLRTFELRWQEAWATFQHAIAMEPCGPYPLMAQALFFSVRGEHEKAVAQARRLLELEPFEVQAHVVMTASLYYGRVYEEAIRAGRAAVDMQPASPYIHYYLAAALAAAGNLAEALSVAERARQHSGQQPVAEGLYGYLAALAGRADAHEVLTTLRRRRSHGYVAALPVAWIYLGLGDYDSALHWMETATTEHDPLLTTTGVCPIYDPIRKDPRFMELERRLLPLG